MAPRPDPFFVSVEPGPLGHRFALYHAPNADSIRGLIVYVHPFAEEMNKSRRMAALQSRALAAEGFAVLQMDLLGCGDSGGDFGDATWAIWVADVVHACRWLQQRHSPAAGQAAPPLWLWGLRDGCLLAAEAAAALERACDFLFWQPTASGSTTLNHFLRMKAAAEMLGGGAKGVITALRRQLADGESTEIAGYMLNPALAAGLGRAVLRPPGRPGRVEWLDTATDCAAGLTPACLRAAEQWRLAGCEVRVQVVSGPAFWQTAEIEEAPELLAATSATLRALERPQALPSLSTLTDVTLSRASTT